MYGEAQGTVSFRRSHTIEGIGLMFVAQTLRCIGLPPAAAIRVASFNHLQAVRRVGKHNVPDTVCRDKMNASGLVSLATALASSCWLQ